VQNTKGFLERLPRLRSLCREEHKEEGSVADNIRDFLPRGQDDSRMYKNVQYVYEYFKIKS